MRRTEKENPDFFPEGVSMVQPLSPEQLLEAYCKSLGKEYPAFAFRINREEVYADSGSDTSHMFISLEEFGDDIE